MRMEDPSAIRGSFVGEPINFRGLVYAPINELGVVHVFGMVAAELGFYVEEVKASFPDCTVRRFTERGFLERVFVEFEYNSLNYLDHEHNKSPYPCNIIVCWKHEWTMCSYQVIELRKVITRLPNPPICRPEQWITDLIWQPKQN